MAYKTVSLGQIVDRIFAGRGFVYGDVTLTNQERELLGWGINRALRVAWESARYSQLLKLEERTYRPPFSLAVNYSAGLQVWDEATEMYWTSLQDGNVGNQPPADGVADDWWEPADGMVRYVQFDQPWEANEIDEDGVDLNDFAYYESPIGKPNGRRIAGCTRVEDSIVMPALDAGVPNKVWVKFRPVAPRVSLIAWAVGTAYSAGDLVYHAGSRESYVAVRATTGEEPDTTVEGGNPWSPVGVPAMFEDYVVLRVLADVRSEEQGKYQTQASADEELERVVHKKGPAAGEPARCVVGRRR